MKILLKNGRVLDPSAETDSVRHLLIVDGVIEKIGAKVVTGNDMKEYDLSGKVVAPGFIDMHVHLREPGFEHKETIETGTLSAAVGGFTAVCCMPNTNPPIDDASVVRFIKERAMAVNQGIVDVYPVAAATKHREGKELAPMAELAEAGAVAFSDDGAPIASAETMRRSLEYASMLEKPIIQHSEDVLMTAGGLMNEGIVATSLGMQPMPRTAETTMIERDVRLAEFVQAQYHVAHISVAESLDVIRFAKRKKLAITCEVTPHHFTLTDEAVRSFDTNTKMNPPLRTRDDVEAMKEGLRDGTIDVIATDHAPHSFDEKQVEFAFAPFGIVGLETAIGLAITELVSKRIITLSEMVRKFSVNPRTILRLPAIKIAEGERANLTFIDPDVQWVVDAEKLRSKSKNTPFDGRKMTGKAVGIFNNGKLFLA